MTRPAWSDWRGQLDLSDPDEEQEAWQELADRLDCYAPASPTTGFGPVPENERPRRANAGTA